MTKTFGIGVSLAVLVVCARPAEALTIHVTAETCHTCVGWPPESLPDITLDAQVTVESVTGMYWHPFYTTWFTGPYLAVTDITGSINGLPMTLAPAPNGSASWLYDWYWPGLVYFSAGGIDSRFIYDNAYILLQTPTGGGYGEQVPLANWNAVAVPDESSSLMLLILSLVGLTLLKRSEIQRKRRLHRAGGR